MENYSGIDIFGIPIYESNIQIESKYIDFVKDLEFERMPIDNGYSTTNKKILDLPELANLKEKIFEHFGQYVYQMLYVKKDTDFKLLNSWATKHKQNDWAQQHDHVNSFVSGILYLDVNPDSGKLHFHKDHMWQNIFPRSVSVPFEGFTPANCHEWVYSPKIGDIFLFPSHLQHSVTKNLSSDTRYVCAFNFYPKGNFRAGDHSDLTI